MRFSATALLALPLLAAAAESPFEQYKAQFQNFLSSFGVGSAGTADKSAAASASDPKPKTSKGSTKAKEIAALTLDNWNSTLFAPVKPDATTPEEWWLLVSGGNKTCFGHCQKVEAAFNESAIKFASVPKAPHLAYLNCDSQPVLCNSWSASTGSLWVLQILPRPTPVDIYTKRLNLTTTTTQTILDYHSTGVKESSFTLHDGYFHPYDGPLAKNGLSLAIGYFFWVFNAIPSWAVMVGISMLSRRMMGRQMGGPPQPQAPGARHAPPGDARS